MTRRFHKSEFQPIDANYEGEDVKVHCMGSKWAIIVRKGNAEMIATNKLKILVKKKVFCHYVGDGRFQISEDEYQRMGPCPPVKAIESRELEFLIPVVDRSNPDVDDY